MHWLILIADGEPPAPPDMGTMLRGPMGAVLLMLFVFVFMTMRSSSRQKREQREMMAKMKKNDRVLTSAGIIGYIVQIKDDETVVLKSGDEANSRITVLRSTILRVIADTGSPETKPAS